MYVRDVYHYALALLRNPADAEDVTQTTFMNAYRAYKRGDVIEKPQNWLIKIAHNVARSRYARSKRRVKEVPLEDHVDQLAVPEDERPNVEGILRALGRLPFNQRAAIVMRELEGRSYAEIADTLGVSVPAVETLIFRARRSLRVRASALRGLASAPLPSSLAQLFEGWGVVAGGGAALGTSFLVKIAVALVAGALATGIGGDHTRPAVAASDPDPVLLAPPWAAASGFSTLTQQTFTNNIELVGVKAVRGAHGKNVVDTQADAQAADAVRGTSAPTTSDSSASASPILPTTTVSSTTQQAAGSVSSIVSTVEQTVSNPTGGLPVQPPSAPTVPTVTVTVPTLPPPPPPPKLP
jgi:RNA polymerase sigma factor (sigma-70 family)